MIIYYIYGIYYELFLLWEKADLPKFLQSKKELSKGVYIE